MDKILLVTGASSDIGMQLIRDVYKEYKLIYAQYHHMNQQLKGLIDDIKNEIEIVPLEADFTDVNSVMEMIRKISDRGEIPNNIVHLPAPKAYNQKFHKDKWENYQLGWEICIHSIVEILKTFMPAMVKAHYGRVVFMLTNNTVNVPAKYQAGYVTVKYALLGLMKSLSVEYMDKGITVNGVSPDMMETKFLTEIPDLIIEQNAANSPLKRNIYVKEVIPVIRHMLSDLGASMTGQNIAITGGR